MILKITSSPCFIYLSQKVCATRLMLSVALLVKIISLSDFAFIKSFTFFLESSYLNVDSTDNV